MCSFNCVAIHKIDMYLKIYIQINAKNIKRVLGHVYFISKN